MPTGNITFGGSEADRTVTVTPLVNGSGSATINLTVSDGSLSATEVSTVMVAAHFDPKAYYEAAQGRTGSPLRAGLHAIIRQHTVVPHSNSTGVDTGGALKFLDQDPTNSNNVNLIHSGRSEPLATFGTSAGWNREHLWPNSYGPDSVEPA